VSDLHEDPASRLAEALHGEVHQGQRYKPFGEITLAEARERAAAMAGLQGWGPMQRVRPVAKAWSDLVAKMEAVGAAQVRELEPAQVIELAERLWVITPDEGLI
jgi:hypothetical protein